MLSEIYVSIYSSKRFPEIRSEADEAQHNIGRKALRLQ